MLLVDYQYLMVFRFDEIHMIYQQYIHFYEQINNDDESLTESLSSSSSSSTAINSLNRLMENYNRTCRQQRRSLSLVYASKAICLIDTQAYYSTFKRILELLCRMTIEHDLLDFNLLDFFLYWMLKVLLIIVTCALLEHQIILKSSDYSRLMLVAECLRSLLFPFQWTLFYVSIVFTAALVCLDVRVPAIMGLRISKFNGNFDNNSNTNNDDVGYSDTSVMMQQCVVHIDTEHIQLPDDMPCFLDRSCFIKELNEILSRFDYYFHSDLSKNYLKNQQRIQGSE